MEHIPVAYTVKQVAEKLGCCEKTVRKLCTQGRLGCVYLGQRCLRIPSVALEDFLNCNQGQ